MVSSLCFSAASTLRCNLLTTPEDIILVIPVVLQAIVTSVLAFTLWNRSRVQLFLACEGWADLLLSLLDLFSQLYPAARSDLRTFKSLDLTIGSLSFLPILFFSLFFCSLTVIDFLVILPPYMRRVTRLFVIFFVPLLVGMHETASLLGISYDRPPAGQSMVVLRSSRDKILWSFFTSATLALYTAFQTSIWCFASLRIIQIMVERRQPEYPHGLGTPRLRGIVWINAGLMLGAVETAIGFIAFGSFGTAFGRRSTRFASRALFCIGLTIGLDHPCQRSLMGNDSIDSTEKATEMPSRQSSIKASISYPVLHSFQQLTPTAATFHEKPRLKITPTTIPFLERPRLLPTPASPKGPRARGGLSGMNQFASIKQGGTTPLLELPRQRVTIHFDKGTPQLDVRLSDFELPYPPPQTATGNTRERSYSPYSPLRQEIPRPFADDPYTRFSSDSSLNRAEIISVPQTMYASEKAKATLIRTPSGRTVNRPTSQVSVLSSYESVGTKETKGKRVMSGEQNLEFFKMLVAEGLRSVMSPQAGQAEQNVDTVTTPRSRTIPSVIVCSCGHKTTQEGDGVSRPDSSHSVVSNNRGSHMFPQAVTDFTSADWLSMTSTREPRSRFTSFTASESVHQHPHAKSQRTLSSDNVLMPSFLSFDSSRSPTEEYYGKLFNPSVEQLSRQSSHQSNFSTFNRRRSRSARSSHRQISFTAQSKSTPSSRQISFTAARPRSSQRQHSLTAQSSSWTKGRSGIGIVPLPLPPPRPLRNPMRSSELSPPPPYESPLRVPGVYTPPLQAPAIYNLPPRSAPAAEPKIWGEDIETPRQMREFSSPPNNKLLERIKSIGRAPHRRTPTPTRARHAHKASLTTEPLVIATGQAQRQYIAATQIEIVQDNPPSPTESESIYSRATYDSRMFVSPRLPVGASWTPGTPM